MSERMLTGRCYCGAVAYEVSDAFLYAASCHCSKCRRVTGSAFKPFGGIEREKLRLTRGGDTLLIVGDPTAIHDVHCGTCGSILYSMIIEPGKIDRVHVTLGTLADEPSIGLGAHIFVGSKAAWETIGDDLPQYEGHAVGEPINRSG